MTDDKWIISTIVNSGDSTLHSVASDKAKNGGVVKSDDVRASFAAGDDNPGVIAHRAARSAMLH